VEEHLSQGIDERARTAAGASTVDPAPRPRTVRWLAGGALALAVLALLWVLLMRDDSHQYTLVFESAGQLVTGDLARIGGTPVGAVDSIEVGDDGQAEVSVSVSNDFAPLHRGSTATIRWQGLVGTANRYVDISPAPNFKPELADGARVEGDDTTSIVEIDQLFNTFDPRTRKGLDDFIHGFADWYAGQEEQASETVKYFPPSLVAATRLFDEINRDSEVLQEALVESSKALGAIEDRSADVTELVGNTGETLGAIGADTESLRAALTDLPPALRQGSETFAALRGPAIDDLERFIVESEPAARALPGFMRRLRPFLRNSIPTFRQLTRTFNSPGAGNDLYDTMRDLPPLARSADSAFPRNRRALRQSTPIFGFIRPYTPDLVAWLRSFAGAMAPYDANGHYVRTMPVFDAFELVDDADGGHFEFKPRSERGRSPNLSTGNLRRCPGSATSPPSDGSAPFVDSGPLANPDCDPSQVVGGTP
jgi:phospholipid/cholesterol/gamma-HCH transport system substrate-binding protein